MISFSTFGINIFSTLGYRIFNNCQINRVSACGIPQASTLSQLGLLRQNALKTSMWCLVLCGYLHYIAIGENIKA